MPVDPSKPAITLQDVSSQVALGALPYGDSRFVDLGDGRASTELRQLRLLLRDASAMNGRFAKIAVTGHRGSGKSTELLQLEDDLSGQFLPMYLAVSNYVLRDCDHADIIIWLVESLVRRFSLERWPIDANLVIRITDWFARKSFANVEAVKDEIRSETGTDFQAEYGFYWLPILLLNRVKSMLIATSTHRRRIRQRLHTYTSEMIFYVNQLLDEARATLQRMGKTPELLLIIDNLDHMPPDRGRQLFFDSAEIFKELRVHLVFTVPIALRLPPYPIRYSFEKCFTIPFVRTTGNAEDEFKPGIHVLVDLVSRRVDLKRLFSSKDVVRYLAKMSGGNVRDLLLLVDYAQLAARAKNKKRMDMESARLAVQRLQAYYEKFLLPKEVFFPLLRAIHDSKREQFLGDHDRSARGVKNARYFAGELIGSGAVIDQDEDGSRYDLHPVVPGIPAFHEFNASRQADGGAK